MKKIDTFFMALILLGITGFLGFVVHINLILLNL